jgi:hypothetical protein
MDACEAEKAGGMPEVPQAWEFKKKGRSRVLSHDKALPHIGFLVALPSLEILSFCQKRQYAGPTPFLVDIRWLTLFAFYSFVRSRRIFRASSSFISLCRGIGCVTPVFGLW